MVETLPQVLMKDVHNNLGSEINQFENDSRNRRMVAELMRPVIEDADIDRRKVVTLDMKYQNFINRLERMEFLFGVGETKPKIFETIDDNFCKMRMEFSDKLK